MILSNFPLLWQSETLVEIMNSLVWKLCCRMSWIVQLLFFLIILSSDKFVTVSGGQIVTHIF